MCYEVSCDPALSISKRCGNQRVENGMKMPRRDVQQMVRRKERLEEMVGAAEGTSNTSFAKGTFCGL